MYGLFMLHASMYQFVARKRYRDTRATKVAQTQRNIKLFKYPNWALPCSKVIERGKKPSSAAPDVISAISSWLGTKPWASDSLRAGLNQILINNDSYTLKTCARQ
uniref:Uncharacterized protein n=1 Tax=Romanomermis culicivorax TaxID=13658 RepID=A0A915HIG6_ROMCU